jgi:polysaccharide biosynthesis protein PslG
MPKNLERKIIAIDPNPLLLRLSLESEFPKAVRYAVEHRHPSFNERRSVCSARPINARILLNSVLAFLCLFAVTRPVSSQTPPTFVGLHIHNEVLSSQPWPTVPMGSIRLWDTETSWNDLEPSKGLYSWSNLDGYLALAKAHGVDILYTFGQTPEWAASGSSSECVYGPGSCFPPSNIQDWDDFVTALVAHSAGKIRYWEIWNEANYSRYWMGDLSTLITMAQHAYKIIKAVDPTAIVLCPSSTLTANDVGAFLNQYLAAGGSSVTDIVAFHGYVNYTLPAPPEGVLDFVAAVKSAMASNGIAGRPIWDTEGSWGLNTTLETPNDGPGYLARDFILQWSSGVSRFYWYAWNDARTGTLWTTQGIQAAGFALGQVYSWIVGTTLASPCSVSSDSTWTCKMTRTGHNQALAVWNSAMSKSYSPPKQYTEYLDLMGSAHPVKGAMTIGSSPVLLVNSVYPEPPTNLTQTIH